MSRVMRNVRGTAVFLAVADAQLTWRVEFESRHAGHLARTVMESLRDNPYFRSPISKNAQHVIDLGTGSGGWASDVVDMLPSR